MPYQVALLLDNGAPVGQRNYYGLTALHRASEEGKLSVVKLLLHRGADVQAKDCDGETALEKAAQQGHRRIVSLLAAWGSDVGFRDAMGYSLTMRAAEWGWLDVLMALIQEKRAALDAVDLWGESAVLKAARQGRKNIVDALIRAGADVTCKDEGGNTLLGWAVRNNWRNLVPKVLSVSLPPPL